MKATTAAFLDLLNQSGIKYEFKERDGKSDWVNVRYGGDNIPVSYTHLDVYKRQA